MTDLVVVGGGIAGLAGAWTLAGRGARVVLLERERALGLHSTARNAAILRTAMPDASIEALALESARLLREPPPGFADRPLVDECGVVIASPRGLGELAPWERRLDARADAERLSPARLAELAPHFAIAARAAWLLPREGRVDLAALVAAFERAARERGVEIETGAEALAPLVERGAVRGLRLAGGRELRAGAVVLASGGWAARIGALAGSRVALRPTRRHLALTAPDARVDPRWPVVWTDGEAFYARPEQQGLLVCACDEVDVDPDRLEVVAEVQAEIAAKAARAMPSLGAPALARTWAGVRTLTADGRFAIGRDPDVEGLAWIAGLGGHGITCCFAVARLAAASLLGGGAREDELAAVDPARLAAAGAPASRGG